MPQYRVYRLDAAGHVAAPPDLLDVQDDEEAMRRAKLLLDGMALEVWQAARFVGQLDPARDAEAKPDRPPTITPSP